MTDSDLTVSILREIRDAVVSTNGRLDQTNLRLDETNARLEAGFAQNDARLTVVEGTLKDLAGQLLIIGRYLKNRTEQDLEELRARVTRLEAKVG